MKIKTYLLIGLMSMILLALLILNFAKRAGVQPNSTSIPVYSPTATSSSLPPVDITVTGASPDRNTIFNPGQQQAFISKFQNPVNLSWLGIKITYKDIYTSKITAIQFNSSLDASGKVLTITTVGPISPDGEYTLSIDNLTKNTNILNVTYLSNSASPIPVSSNNPALIQYLPYEADNYSLDYMPEQNVYVFHFKMNYNSSDDLQTQYQKAKQDATDFIQSKGVDINSIVIQWRYN